MTCYALFETVLGPCGLAWNGSAIAGVQLPEKDRKSTVARLVGRTGAVSGTPPPFVREVMQRIAAHLDGAPQDFSDVKLDLSRLPEFHRRASQAARRITPGTTSTYGALAAAAGSPGGARAAGRAMATNGFPILVPCHRVVASGRSPGGFSAFGGLEVKEKLLAAEGVILRPPLFSGAGRLPFDARRAVGELRRADPALAKVMDSLGPFRLKLARPQATPFEALAEAIVYQQLAGAAAEAIFGRFVGLYRPRRFPTPQQVAATSARVLRRAGLSRSKAAALKDLARKCRDGVVPPSSELARLTDERIVERLTAVRGVGRWTVEMFLIFHLGRPDVLPVTDYGVQQGARVAFGGRLPTPKALARKGERWRPWRTVASWYLWRATEQGRSKT